MDTLYSKKKDKIQKYKQLISAVHLAARCEWIDVDSLIYLCNHLNQIKKPSDAPFYFFKELTKGWF